MNGRLLLFLIVTLFVQSLLCQEDLLLGSWKAHLPYQRGTSVTQSDEKVIYSTPWSIFTIDKQDFSASFLSKVDGLSDIGIEKVSYDHFNDQLFIIYTNSNIDIVKDADIINVPNIKENTTIVGNKKVNEVHFVQSTQAFFSTDFGIVSFNPQDYNFGSTILTGIPINNVTSKDNVLYASSSEGVYYIDQSLESNLADFANWNFIGQEKGLPSLYNCKSVVHHNNSIYIGLENEIFKSDNTTSTWRLIYDSGNLELEYLVPTDDRLIAGWRGEDFQNDVLFFDEEDNFMRRGGNCAGIPLEAIRDESGRIWYADLFGKIRFAEDYEVNCTQTSYDSPYSVKVSDIAIKENQVLVASGGVAENFTFLFSREGFYLGERSRWQNFNEFENDEVGQFDLLSVFRVAFHPTLSKLYAGSYWAGLLEYDQKQDSYQLYNKTNSSLRGAIGDPARERVSGLAFDEDENLWVATYNAPEPINVLTPDGEWRSFAVPGLGTLTDVVIDLDGYKWYPVDGSSSNGGILVHDSGPSLQSTADDLFRFISREDSEITTNVILCATVDLDGAVWVGTNQGPVIFDCGFDVFDRTKCEGDRRMVFQDSILAFLLADQQINAIEVDGANRKWLGTRNGLFVQSAQGDQQVAHFTVDNSPLFDNEITALAYDGEIGVMWIGTNKGVISYRTRATVGGRIHLSDQVYAFPNPVRPEYRGPIAIKGLVTDANVKITDINGLLVSEVTALGGQAIWDGRDLKGNEVNSGVYLVFSADVEAFDNPDAFVTKIMVLR